MKARLPKGFGGGAPSNMAQLAQQAQKMQNKMEELGKELDATEYTVTTGGSAVNIVMTGDLVIRKLDISPEVVDPDDVEMLSDLITAAVNEVIVKATSDKEAKMGEITGGLNLPGVF